MLFLVDNSVLARTASNDVVFDALERLTHRDVLATCLPLRLELGFSARNAADFQRAMAEMDALVQLPISEAVEAAARQIQSSLATAGAHRSAGAVDVMSAATAVVHGATVVHYDADFEAIARAVPEFEARWVVPRGSVA